MAKKITGMVKLQIAAGKATPAPPVGSVLGPHGINIMGFCKEFNERTAKQAGMIIPVGYYHLSGSLFFLYYQDPALRPC